MERPAVAAAFLVTIAALALASVATCRSGASAAGAGESAGAHAYAVTGSDRFSIGEDDVTSEVTFRGTQQLTWKPRGTTMRFESRVAYARFEQGAATDARAHFVSDLLPTGEQHDRLAEDPEYLSILNQPFSVRLDLPTLSDLRKLRTDVPFDFPSPMTGSTMHGRLRHLGEAPIDGRRAVGVGFAAAGTMSGTVPDRPGLTIKGAIALRGTAYYDAGTALLLSSETTVTILGNVSNPGNSDTVHITYTRAIRSGALLPAAAPAGVPASSEAAPPAAQPIPAAS